MLRGQVDQARKLHLQNRGLVVMEGRTWKEAVLADFAELRRAGIDHPLMAEIEASFAAPTPVRQSERPVP